MIDGPIKVAIVGAGGKMGRAALQSFLPDPTFSVVAAIVREAHGRSLSHLIESGADDYPLEDDLAAAIDRASPDVVLDLSLADAAVGNAHIALSRKIPLVSGVSGLSGAQVEELQRLSEAHNTPALLAPNFAIGAILGMKFAEMAARWIPDVEIIELHHAQKVDAPSGTAVSTAERIARARRSVPRPDPTTKFRAEGARGATVDGVTVHSVRLPGLLAHQQVIFGAPGEVLTIRHDATDRSVYMPGIKLCLKSVRSLQGLTVGMDSLID